MVKKVNLDLRGLTDWLNANRISLNSSKTEYVLFRHPNKIINFDVKFKLNGKRLFPSKFIKYLGVLIDENLSWNFHINEISKKLSRANGMLCKVRHFVSSETLRSIYYAIFSSHLTYSCQVWGQNGNPNLDKIHSLQRKAIRIINFAPFRSETSHLFKKSNILSFSNQIVFSNCLFVFDQLTLNLPEPLSNFFTVVSNVHSHGTVNSNLGKLFQNQIRTLRYGKYSIRNQCISDWNESIKEVSQILQTKCISENKPVPAIIDLSRSHFKFLILDFLR